MCASSRTSWASSAVTIPSIRPRSSSTGTAENPYRAKVRATSSSGIVTGTVMMSSIITSLARLEGCERMTRFSVSNPRRWRSSLRT